MGSPSPTSHHRCSNNSDKHEENWIHLDSFLHLNYRDSQQEDKPGLHLFPKMFWKDNECCGLMLLSPSIKTCEYSQCFYVCFLHNPAKYKKMKKQTGEKT